MAHELYSDFAIQNTFMSSVVLVNEVSEVQGVRVKSLLTFLAVKF